MGQKLVFVRGLGPLFTRGVTPIVTCTPYATAEMRKRGTFFMVRHDTCVLRLGYQKHEKKSSKIDMLNMHKG